MSSNTNIITVYFHGKHQTCSKTQYQYHHGQVLYFADLDLPDAFEVHFSNTPKGKSKTQIGTNNRVNILDEYFWSGATEIYVWIYLHAGESDGETEYEVRIPLSKRAKPTDEEPSEVQQSSIDQAIAALATAVEKTSEDVEQVEGLKTDVIELKNQVELDKESADLSATTASAQAQEAIRASQNAQESAENAGTSATDAANNCEQARRYAVQAEEYKNIAAQKSEIATEASASALEYKDETLSARDETLQAKTTMNGYLVSGKDYLDETEQLKNDTNDLKNQVQELANAVQTNKNIVDEQTTIATTKAEEASSSASSAQTSASTAEQSKNSANESAQSASQSAEDAEEAKNIAISNASHYPYIGDDNYWYVWDTENEMFINTNVKAEGDKGIDGEDGEDARLFTFSTPCIIIPTDSNGYTTAEMTKSFDLVFQNMDYHSSYSIQGSGITVSYKKSLDDDSWYGLGGVWTANTIYRGISGTLANKTISATLPIYSHLTGSGNLDYTVTIDGTSYTASIPWVAVPTA